MSCGISPAFAGLFPTEGQVTHVLRTRAPCAHPLYCYRKLRTRLACVKHAASVRSEPGSNSRLKLVLRKSKSRLAAGPDVLSELLIARFTQASNEFWHILPACQRAASSVLQSGTHPAAKYTETAFPCQSYSPRFPQAYGRAPHVPLPPSGGAPLCDMLRRGSPVGGAHETQRIREKGRGHRGRWPSRLAPVGATS